MSATFSRRAALARLAGGAGLLTGAGLLGGCGGGGDAGAGVPAIQSFVADRTSYLVGERARLTVRFSGGAGRLEPDMGAVVDGEERLSGVLDATRRFELVVQAPGQPTARRELVLPVAFRNRYVVFPAPAMAFHATVALADGGALVLGGSRGTGVLSDAIERFDPATRGFTRIGSMSTGRSDHSAVRVGAHQVLVFGGALALGPNVAELVDDQTGMSVSAGALAQPRTHHAAVRLADGRVLAVGGLNRNSAELWDPATRSWRLLNSRMAHVREFPTATLLTDGRVLVAGGDDYGLGRPYVLAEIFDPLTERFSPVPGDLGERRLLHGAWRLRDGSVLIVGGEGSSAATGQVGAWSTVWRFDPAGNTFAAAAPLERARTAVVGTLTPDDELLLIGGQDQDWRALSDGVARQPAGSIAMPMLPTARAWHTVTRLTDGRVLVLGGSDEARAQFALGAVLYE